MRPFVAVGESCHHTYMDAEVDLEAAGVAVSYFDGDVAVDVRHPAEFVLDVFGENVVFGDICIFVVLHHAVGKLGIVGE